MMWQLFGRRKTVLKSSDLPVWHNAVMALENDTGAYLSKLEGEYALIDRYKPIDAKPGSRLQKYYIRDNFLSFWFRFIYKNLSAVETGNFAYIREIVERDYATWSGRILERFFHELYAASG